MATPFVSVLIDTYNHERFIEEALASVLAQDYPVEAREIIVVDDGSTDRTPEILRRFESQAKILRKPNGGQASAFNFGIPHCKGEIVTFLDGDDWWAPNKISAVVAAFEANPTVGLVGHSITEVLNDCVRRSELVRESPQFRIDSVAGARTFRLRKSFLGTSRSAYRRELLQRIGPIPEALVIEADEYLFTLGAYFSEVLLLRDPLTFYRVQGQNLFLLGDGDLRSLRRRYDVLVALANSLRERFAAEQVPAPIARAVVETIEVEAGFDRLFLYGGKPWETVKLELDNYRIMHEGASLFRRLVKSASLFPAFFLPPKNYFALRRKLAANSIYRKARAKLFPQMAPKHVDRVGQWGAL